LRVLELDQKDDEEAGFDASEYQDLILKSAEQALVGLPSPYRERLHGVPVVLEQRPNQELVKGGIDPRALALFDGPEPAPGSEELPTPTRIVLYTANLPAEFEDEEELESEVELTLLQEIGDYFGLDDDELDRLGLE
jgi:predicted Zn-dependent protease with MMP-like domain